MSSPLRPSSWLAVIVLGHLAISLVHGAAHSGAHVALSAPATAFVFVVILTGPVAGLVMMRPAARLGAGLIALTMAGALVFGVVNHFVVASADHVAHVDPAWRATFAGTAALLAVTELAGCALALAAMREKRVLS